MQFSEVPVACADLTWLTKEFLPNAARLSGEPRVVLMPTDSHPESDFLLGRIKRLLQSRDGLSVRELQLSASDPTLAWESLFGTPDECSSFDSASECDVLLVRGGNYLPTWFVAEHLARLDAYAKSYRLAIVLPVSRSVTLPSTSTPILSVPAFIGTDEALRRDFVKWAIHEYLPDLRDDPGIDRQAFRDELCNIICQAQPHSRTTVEFWLQFYLTEFDRTEASSVLEVARASPPTVIPSLPEPADVLSRSNLRSEFENLLQMLQRANTALQDVTEHALFRSYHDVPRPFDSPDPQHWFIGCVSYLSCIYFDAANKRALPIIERYRVDVDRDDIVAVERNNFTESLRLLRTYFQHGLSPDDSEDRKTLERVQEWCTQTLGAGRHIARENARVCVAHILSQFRETVEQVSDVVLGFVRWPTAYAIGSELNRSLRSFAEHEIERAIKRVIEQLELDLDSSEVIKLHLDQIIKDLKNSTCRIETLDEELMRVSQKYCLALSRRPPRIGDWLKSQGLVGRQIGECAKKLNEAWDCDATMSEDEYMRMAEFEVLRIQGINK